MDVKYTMKPRTTMKTVMGVEGIFLTALFPCLVQATDEVQTNFHDNSSHNSSVDSAVHERFHVVVVDFHNVSVPFIISMCVVLASGAKIGFHRNNKLSSILPESCLLILVGLLLALVFWALGLGVYTLTPHTFFLLLLPPIVLDAAYFMPNRAFFDNIGTILVYAVVGSLLNTLAMAVTLWGASWLLWGSEGALLLHCLVFGALIGAVDPVAVLSLFDEVHVNEILHVIVFGESLLNDGVTVVLYHMFDSYSAIGVDNIRTVDVAAGVASFVVVSLASTAIGIVYGLATALITRFTDHVRVLEPLLVILMGYLSYLTAEIFHLSGILSCTFCAISMKKYVEANISHKSHTTIKYLMKMLAGVCETILFILLGISTVNSSHNWDTGFVLIALTACLVFRTLGVLLLTGCVNRLRIIKLNYVDQFIMSYGALRGAMAFSLVILLNDSLYPQKRLFLTTTIVITFFTVFIQGSTIKPLVNIFRVKKAPHDKPSMNEQIHDRMLDHLMAGVEDVTGFFGHHDLRLKFEHINTKYLKPILVRQRSLRKRGLSIVNMYQKLAEKDARQMISNGSLSKLTTHHMSQSMADHIAYTQLQGSQSKLDRPLSGLPFYDRNSCTQLDLQALEATDTRKMRDDSKTHHIVVDAMFRPRLKFSRHGRHMLPESDVYDLPLFHHKARMHLRHVLNHHHHKSHHGNGHSNAHISENGKPRKNVSFGQVTEVCAIDMESDRRSDRADIETESSHSLPQSVESSSSTNSDSNGGITFTAAPQTEGDVSAEKVIPTAVEVTLPWSRSCITCDLLVSDKTFRFVTVLLAVQVLFRCSVMDEEGGGPRQRKKEVDNGKEGVNGGNAPPAHELDLQYTVDDNPPWYICILLGFQHYLTMFGATLSMPLIIAPAMCVGNDIVATSEILGTVLFVSGVVTALQATVGSRLPIIQGGTFAFLTPTFAILNLDKWKCPLIVDPPQGMNSSNGTDNATMNGTTPIYTGSDEHKEVWQSRMREIQGAIILASLFQVLIGLSGVVGVLLRFIGPLAIAPTIALIGMALFQPAADFSSKNWWVAMMTIVLITAFSQYMRNIDVPCFVFNRKDKSCNRIGYPIFKLFPVILAILLAWGVCALLTVTDAIPNDYTHWAYPARTDNKTVVLRESLWFRFPYPGQWGTPTFSTASVFGMLAGVLAGMLESVGDYYACARMAGAPPPPIHAVNRGIFTEGLGCVLAGCWGTGTGTTSYSENIGAIGITKVGSRRVIQVAGLILIFLGVFAKFGAFFVTIPEPIVGGVFMVMFGMITAVGISNLQFVDLNSTRNLFIFGFAFFFGMTLPQWMTKNGDSIRTGSEIADQIITVLLSTSMFVGGITGFILDNTVPGTLQERGMLAWRKEAVAEEPEEPEEPGLQTRVTLKTYDLPLITKYLRRWAWPRYIPISPTFDVNCRDCGGRQGGAVEKGEVMDTDGCQRINVLQHTVTSEGDTRL